MITIRIILDKLNIPCLKRVHPSEHFYSLCIRNEYAVNLGNASIINILTASEFDTASTDPSGACFIIGEPCSRIISESMEAVLFPSDIDPTSLLEACNHITSEYERYCTYKTNLNLLIQAKPDFPSVFHLFSTFYDNPVCFGDSGGSILFFANLKDNLDEYDESIRYWVSQGHVPYEYSRKNGNTEGAAKVAASPVPVIMDTGYASKFRRMSYRTCKDKNRYNNYLCVVEAHHPYLPFDQDVLVYTANLILEAFTPETMNQIESPRNHVLRSLLAGKIKHKDAMNDRMQRCYICDSNYYLVAIIGLRDITLGQSKLIYFRHLLNTTEPLILQIMKENELVLLIQAQQTDDYQEKLSKLTSYLQNESTLYLSYSRPFHDIMDTAGKYTEADLAYRIGSELFPNNQTFSFSELYFPILLKLANQQTDMRNFLVDGVLQLYLYDQQKHSEFFYTLHEYLICNMNILECAKKLHIHRNTAIYRLNKAKQFLSIDFNCFDDIVKLYLSIQYVIFLFSENDSVSTTDYK